MRNAYRAAIGGFTLLAVVAGSNAWDDAVDAEEPASSLVVEDTADILVAPAITSAVEDLRFYEPTDVVVFTHRGGEEARTDDRALNDAVLAYARQGRTEWLSPDGEHWADDLFIFAVDPEGRLVGTYFGENREVGDDEQLEIQEAAKDDFRAGYWTDGVVAGLEEAAPRLSAPFIKREGGAVLVVLASLFLLVGFASWFAAGVVRAVRNRRVRREADERLAQVQREVSATEAHARRIPEESRYGGRVLRRFDEYRRGIQELTGLGDQVATIPRSSYNRKAVTSQLTDYLQKGVELDHLDDSIADTATFVNRDKGWAQAWERQVGPLREDLDLVEPTLTEKLPKKARDLPEGDRLRDLAAEARTRLDAMQDRLERDDVTPDDALDELRLLRDQLAERLEALSVAVAQALGSTEKQQKTLEQAIERARASRAPEATIVGTAYPGSTYFPLYSFNSGVSSGSQQIAASSGGTSGYSGGGFSGAGSSSSF